MTLCPYCGFPATAPKCSRCGADAAEPLPRRKFPKHVEPPDPLMEQDTSIVIRSFFYVLLGAYEWERHGGWWALGIGLVMAMDLSIRKHNNRKAVKAEEDRYAREMNARYDD